MNLFRVLFLIGLPITKAFLINFNPSSESLDKYKLCKNCIHIKEDNHCQQFGTIDVVSGNVHYFSCSVVRSEEMLCGSTAKFYHRYIPFNETTTNKTI